MNHNKIQDINLGGLVVNSPEYWELRHKRDDWPRWSSWAMTIAAHRIPDNGRVLIVGCGQGMEAYKLLELNPAVGLVHAFDCSPTAITKARSKFVEERIMFTIDDVFKLAGQYGKHAYDYIISIQNFEHWKPETHEEALRNIWYTLKPGGRMFFTGVGVSWNLDKMNYTPMQYKGLVLDVPNDYHYNNWSEQDVYDLFCTRDRLASVRFWRRRAKNRVIAEATKT